MSKLQNIYICVQHIPVPWVHPDPWHKLQCNFRSVGYFPWCYILFLYFLWPQEAEWALFRPQENSSIRTISKLSQALPRHVFSFPFPFSTLSCSHSLVMHTLIHTIDPNPGTVYSPAGLLLCKHLLSAYFTVTPLHPTAGVTSGGGHCIHLLSVF